MFHKRFTEEEVLRQLSTRPMTVYELQNAMGCKKRTAENLMDSLMKQGLVSRRNRSHPNKPSWEYSVVEGAQIKRNQAEHKLIGMARKIK